MTTVAPPRVLEQLRALSHDIRFELVRHLAQGERCVCDLEAVLALPQPKVSYHLGVLREAGLVSAEQRGKNTFYRLEQHQLFQIGGTLLNELYPPSPALTHQTESIC